MGTVNLEAYWMQKRREAEYAAMGKVLAEMREWERKCALEERKECQPSLRSGETSGSSSPTAEET